MTSPDPEYGLSEPLVPVSLPPPSTAGPASIPNSSQPSRIDRTDWFARGGVVFLGLAHAALIWIGFGGWAGLTGEWPLLQADHGIHYHHGLLMGSFLKTTGMTAGYDPGFMSGYPMSIVSDLSSTFSTLVMLAAGDRPALGYKLHVFGCSVAVPWLMALACMVWKVRPTGILAAVALYLIYFWMDFPMKYVGLGMLNYLLSIPLGLVALAALTAYFEKGSFGRWIGAALACSAVFLVHLTSPMLLGPAGLSAYGVAIWRGRKAGTPLPLSRHVGLWSMVPVILGLNLFWLWPGYLLASTKGASDTSFAHSEGVWRRIREIFWEEWPIEGALIGLGIFGLLILARRRPVVAAGLGGFLAAGFSWGYLAGAFRSLDSLQPGRHTYAFYSAAAIVSGIGLAEILERLRPVKLGKWFLLALILGNVRSYGPILEGIWSNYVFQKSPFLSSQPTPRIAFVVDSVRRFVRPGERLLFEETGVGLPGLIDPYEIRHCSAVLPSMAGVELIGGPYLHSTVTANFTQFGENKLFEKKNWNLDYFVRYAKLYRPSAICCWSPKARSFCFSNPDLIKVEVDDGVVLIGRIRGFEGSTIKGHAEVEAGPNRLVVRNAVSDPADGPDGLVVLRYHAVPYLKARPATPIESVLLEDDPVPFIGIRPTTGPITIEMVLPPRR